jgi:hypothetical protein
MSASTTQPMAGHANQSAPLGAIAILVGALALGAVGIALGATYKAAAPATAPSARRPRLEAAGRSAGAPMDYALRTSAAAASVIRCGSPWSPRWRPERRLAPDPVAQGSPHRPAALHDAPRGAVANRRPGPVRADNA